MQYLSMENVSKAYGDKVLFNNINLSISKGDKIALVAKNGTGKTTLLRVLAGEEGVEGETASIHFARDISISYLRQDPKFDPEASVLETVYDSDNPSIKAIKAYEMALLEEDQEKMQASIATLEDLKAWDIEARLKEVLGKLNIHDLSVPVKSLSGGQKKRLALAKILISEPDFLILDEPTNHLDLEMIEWLEQYLQRQQLTLFMVTHDRYFLERVCNEIVELERGILYTYRGNYSDYLEKKALRQANEEVVLDKTKKLFKKELDWIRRQPKARGTKAKSRIDTFYDIKEKAHQKLDDQELDFIIQSRRLGSKILELYNVEKAFDDHVLIDDFSYKFKKNERVGIVGPNGAGKSTFLKIITNELKPDKGRIVVGDTVYFGHYRQDGIQLTQDRRVIDVVRDIAEYIPLEKGHKLTAESLLERFMFPRDQQRVYVSQLSGGERRRLHLLTVLMKNPNFLILDEPTNDLDILTLNVLENYLESFQGVLIIVTHDRYFMDKLVDHLFVLEGYGTIKDYNGTYSRYRDQHGVPSRKKVPAIQENKPPNTLSTQTEPDKIKISYKEKMKFKEAEEMMEKLEKRKEEINQQFLDPGLGNDRIQDLSIELGEIQKSLAEFENTWYELAEKMGL